MSEEKENRHQGNSFFQRSFLTDAIRSANASALAVTTPQRPSRTASLGTRAEPAPTAKTPAANHPPRFSKLTPPVELTGELAEVERRLALTDELIDQIVYKLYGLTEEGKD